MAIYRIIDNSAFGPAEVSLMIAAYEAALPEAGITDRSDPRTESLALRIVHSVKGGQTDIGRIVEFAIRGDGLAEVAAGAANHRKAPPSLSQAEARFGAE